MKLFSKETKTAYNAMEYAQWIAFAPMVFQASRVLRDLGILKAIEESGQRGITLEDIRDKLNLPHYGVRVLLEAGLGIGLLIISDELYKLTKTGNFILNDKMTRVNMDFAHDVCYEGLFNLEESIKKGTPEGLHKFGPWNTIYDALAHLDPHIQESWFSFDHYYSDISFPSLLSLVYKNKPGKLLDIGGNTGKWALASLKHDKDVKITILDLPGQIGMAKKSIDDSGFAERVSYFPTNILDKNITFPKGFDIIWMSQFLDCFSDEQIVFILKRCHDSINKNGFVYILEPFWDNQKFSASAFSMQMTSLYFTAIANGNSQMYSAAIFYKLIEEAGFIIEESIENIGVSNTLLKLRVKE